MTGSTSWSGGWSSSGSFFDLPAKAARLKELEALQADPGFWSNQDRARAQLQEIKTLRNLTQPAEEISRRIADARGMGELLAAEPDEALTAELATEVENIARALEAYELKTLLRSEEHTAELQSP